MTQASCYAIQSCMKLTLLDSVMSPFSVQQRTLSHTEAFNLLTQHRRVASKFNVKLFIPAVMNPVSKGGCKHALDADAPPHRCDESVKEVTALAYDADAGTQTDLDVCLNTLRAADISHVAYSSFSHRPSDAKARFRLVVFVDRPIRPEEFKGVRAAVLHSFKIPALEAVCAGLSHSYFLPSCPPSATPVVYQYQGTPLCVDDYVGLLEERTSSSYTRPTEYATPTPAALRTTLLEYLERQKDPRRQGLIRAVLDGRPLPAVEGGRHAEVIFLRGILAGVFTDVEPTRLVELVRPSLEALNTDGRDFVAEFENGFDAHQAGILGADSVDVERRRPEGYRPSTAPPSARPALLAQWYEALIPDRVRTTRRRGDDDKAEVLESVLNRQPLSSANKLTKAAWLLVATNPTYPPEIYVELLKPVAVGTVFGPARLEQTVREALYTQLGRGAE